MAEFSAGDLNAVSMTEVQGCLVVTMPGDASEEAFAQLFDAVSQRLVARRAPAVVLDFSGVRILDLHEFARVRTLAHVAGFLGARVVLVALNPGIAAFLAQAGAEMGDMHFCLQMEDAFALLAQEA